jgi:hypothetical protein
MGDDKRELSMNPAQSKTPGMPGNSMRENRETPSVSGSSKSDRLEKATSYTASMYAGGESDELVVPTKHPNKGEQSPAEGAEGSSSTKGNTEDAHTYRTQCREYVFQGAQRCAESSSHQRSAFTPCTQGKSRMRYVAAKFMWRPANKAVGINGPIAPDAT